VQGAIGEIRREMRVLSETYTEVGVILQVRAHQAALARLKARFKI
jgi:hypothetical protein